MKSIYRDHEFVNRLTFIKMGKKYFYLSHERETNWIKIPINKALKNAFDSGNWKVFEIAEAAYWGGTIL
ncbi:MAG: hypothetical protein WC579_01580 [Candidatus Paceibacterota bacterium]